MSRANAINAKPPQIWVRLTLYATDNGGKTKSIMAGYGCPCFSDPDRSRPGFSGWPQLGDDIMQPGAIRELGYVFLNPDEALLEFKKAGKFYLWDGGIIGDAEILQMPDVQNH